VFFRLAGITSIIGDQDGLPVAESARGTPLPYVDHEADRLLKRLARCGIPVPPPGQGCMDLRLTPQEVGSAQDWLASRRGSVAGELLVAIAPGSRAPSKVWPAERYVALGRVLIEELSALPIVFGGREDQLLGDLLIRAWGRGANAAGELTVRQTAAALANCCLYVGNDTGTMHLAAAVGTPCVAVFSAQDLPGRWHPYGTGHYVLRSVVPCEGCHLRECVKFDLRCLKQIEVSEVASICRAALSENRRPSLTAPMSTTAPGCGDAGTTNLSQQPSPLQRDN